MAPLKAAINALDPAPDKKKDLTFTLALLSELCEAKVKEFTDAIEEEHRIAGTSENKTIPITNVLARHKEYRAYVKSDAGKIATETASAVKKFIAGGSDKIVDGIASLLTTGIEGIIGAGSGAQQTLETYYIVVQQFAIIRFDVRVWSRQIEASGLTKQIESTLAIVAYKSSVDISKLTFNTLLAAYQEQLSRMNIAEEEWKEYIDTATQLHQKLMGKGGQGPALASAAAPSEAPSAAPVLNAAVAGSSLLPSGFRAPGHMFGTLWQ